MLDNFRWWNRWWNRWENRPMWCNTPPIFMSHLPIFKKKSADYHRFFYLCLSLEIGEFYRLVGIRLKLVSHQTISPPTKKSADFSRPKKSADCLTDFLSRFRWVLSLKIGGNPPIWMSHQQIRPPTKKSKSVGAYITLNIKIYISFQIFQIENLTTFFT